MRLIAVAAALAFAHPAGAAQRDRASRPARAPASTSAPAAREPAAAPAPPAATASPALTPAATPARTTIDAIPLPPPPAGTSLLSRGGWLGLGVGPVAAFDVGRSSAVHLDYGIPRTPAAWRRLELEWHLGVAFSRLLAQTALTRVVIPPFSFQPVVLEAGAEDVKVWLLEVVPTARVRWRVAPGVAFFADGGAGLCQTVERYDRSEMFVGRSHRTEYVTGVALRAGLGLSTDVGERWRVVFQPLALSLQLGPKYSAFTPSLGLAYRL